MKRISIVSLLVFLLTTAAAAQNGFLRGNIVDGDFSGPLIGAAVFNEANTGVGTVSDFEGNYSLSLPPGTYTIKISYISYASQTFKNVVIKPGAVTILDAIMKSSAEELGVVNVVGETSRNNDVGFLLEMKNSNIVVDGLTAQAFRKAGDGDLSAAMKRVTGVTVEGGKYVFVRGLGDRYTKTILNGMEIPGLDPDANSVQIDIFPTNVIENVAVYKTFSPDWYGDFTGGLVNVITKKYPEKKSTQFSAGISFVPNQHFNADYILYDNTQGNWAALGGRTHALDIPIDIRNKAIPDETALNPALTDITAAFDAELAVKNRTALPNGSFSFSHGNQINQENGATKGYSVVFNYNRETVFYNSYQSNDYLKDNELEVLPLFKRVTREGSVGKQNTMWSTLATGSYKKGNNSYSATLLHSQSGEATAAKRINRDFNQNQATLIEDVLTYTQRNITTLMLEGSHVANKYLLKWKTASTYARVYDPDFRESRISVTDGDTSLSTGNGAGIDRFWRDLNEFNQAARGDISRKYSPALEVSAGLSGAYKFRDFETFEFKHRRNDLNNIQLDPDWFLQSGNLWSSDPDDPNFRNGTYTLGNYQPANNFSAQQTVFSGYMKVEQRFFGTLKAIYGVRLEKADMYYTGQDNLGLTIYDNQKTLNELNLLPSLNLVYTITDKTNVRLAGNRSIARPSFKEKSIAQIYDPISKRTFSGNIDLEQTLINNFDFRFEHYMSPRELLAVSAFYKTFDGHIEMVSFPTSPANLKPRNSGEAFLYGAEVELKKNFGSDRAFWKNMFFGGNVTIVYSAVDINSVLVDASGQTEYELRSNNLRPGETLSNFRPMAGQSPYAINANLSYELPESKASVSVSYNVQGQQLSVVASGRVPDVYTVPFHSLDFNAFYNFGKNANHRLTAGVRNILNDDRSLVYKSFGAGDEFYTSFIPGAQIGVSYNYSF
jgi:TonB-dependent receptor